MQSTPVEEKRAVCAFPRLPVRVLRGLLSLTARGDARLFVLLSDACLPIVSFDEAVRELMGDDRDWKDDKSLFDMHEKEQHRDQHKYLRQYLAEVSATEHNRAEVELLQGLLGSSVSNSGIAAHSQWCVLTRKHAEILCKDEDEERRRLWLDAYSKALKKDDVHSNLTLAPDELFILTYLKDFWR